MKNMIKKGNLGMLKKSGHHLMAIQGKASQHAYRRSRMAERIDAKSVKRRTYI